MKRRYREITKKEVFIEKIKHLFNIELENDKECAPNQKRNWLYTEIKMKDFTTIGNYLINNHIHFEKHLKDYYWIKL